MKIEIDNIPGHHRQLGFARYEVVVDGEVSLVLEKRRDSRRMNSSEMVREHINSMARGRPSSLYKEEEAISIFPRGRHRIDVEIMPGGYRYGRTFSRNLKDFVAEIAEGLRPASGPRI